jgi:outer membrane lipoprotein carrier protein
MSLLSSSALVVLTMIAAMSLPAGAPGAQVGGATGQPAPAPSAQEVAERLQKKYDTILDFSADFVHRYEGGTLRRTREERGTLLLKKPGKMRWTYKQPEEKVFVSDGVRFYQYVPLDRQVTVADAPDEGQPGLTFLSGKGRLTRDFNVSFAQSQAPDRWTLHLEPKTPQPQYDWLEIAASRDRLELRTLVVAEKQGSRSTFTFGNFKENPGLADKDFEFTIPKGVEVINAGKR